MGKSANNRKHVLLMHLLSFHGLFSHVSIEQGSILGFHVTS